MNKQSLFSEKLEESISYVINRSAIKIKTNLFKKFKECGFDITPEQMTVLYGLQEKNGQYQKELGDKILKDKPNVTRLLDILEKRRLVERKADTNDRRKFKVFITEEGGKTLEKLLPIAKEVKKQAIKDIPENDLKILVNILNKISKNIDSL